MCSLRQPTGSGATWKVAMQPLPHPGAGAMKRKVHKLVYLTPEYLMAGPRYSWTSDGYTTCGRSYDLMGKLEAVKTWVGIPVKDRCLRCKAAMKRSS